MMTVINSTMALFSLAGLTMFVLLLLVVRKIRPVGESAPQVSLARSVGGN